MRRSHKGPNRNFVGLDECSKIGGKAVYIYIYGYGLDGRAGPEKCLLLNGGRGTVLRMMLEIYNDCFFIMYKSFLSLHKIYFYYQY